MKKYCLFLLLLTYSIANAQVERDSIYSQVDKMAAFKEGEQKFYEFVRENFNVAEVETEINGMILLNFIVEIDGTVSDVNVLRGVQPYIDTEVMQIIKKTTGDWLPAEYNQSKVRSRLTLPINVLLKPKEKQEEIIKYDKEASYEGGFERFKKDFVSKFMISTNLKGRAKGLAMVTFDVEADGTLSNFKVSKNTTGESDEKILKVIRKLNKWTPAQAKGKAVKSTVTLPLIFTN